MREATEADSVEASTKRLPKFSQAKRQKDSDSERADWSVMLFMLLLSGCFLLHTLEVVGLSVERLQYLGKPCLGLGHSLTA